MFEYARQQCAGVERWQIGPQDVDQTSNAALLGIAQSKTRGEQSGARQAHVVDQIGLDAGRSREPLPRLVEVVCQPVWFSVNWKIGRCGLAG